MDRVLSWAEMTLRDCERAVRRMVRLHEFVLDDDDNICRVHRVVRAKKKHKGKAPPPPTDSNTEYRCPKMLTMLLRNTLWADTPSRVSRR